jgi:hypothetical protein
MQVESSLFLPSGKVNFQPESLFFGFPFFKLNNPVPTSKQLSQELPIFREELGCLNLRNVVMLTHLFLDGL